MNKRIYVLSLIILLTATFTPQAFAEKLNPTEVTASSETSNHPVQYIHDNNLFTYWYGRDGNGPWRVTFDLGGICDLKKIKIYWKKIDKAKNVKKYTIKIADEKGKGNWDVIHKNLKIPRSTEPGDSVSLDLSGHSARYVRIKIHDGNTPKEIGRAHV